jgi:hypothetical protein
MTRLGQIGLVGLLHWALAPAWAATLYVNGATGNDGWTGLCETWDGGTCGPKATIQAAISAASAGDEILVAPGRYFENVHFDGKNVAVWAENPSVNLPDPLDPGAASIIDGSQPADPNLGSAVRFAGTELPACRLDGFTITGGTGIWQTAGYTKGGGIFGGNGGTYGIWTCATIVNCTVTANTARFGGGLSQCGGRIDNCHITQNWTAYPDSNHSGGGMQACCGVISNCRIAGNHAFEGGGMHTCNGALILNCEITDNVVEWSGGAMMWCDYSTVVNCDLSRNTASTGGLGAGGAVFSQPATYVNCTIANNTALSGGGIYAWQANAPTIYNSVLWGNVATNGQGHQIRLNTSNGTYCTLTIEYSDVQGGQAGVWVSDPTWCVIEWGAGMLALDPVFVDPDQGDFRLATGSPCIDAANNTRVPLDTQDLDGDGDTSERVPLDLDGQPRFVDDPAVADTGNGTLPIVDMGAYERQVTTIVRGDLNCDGSVGFGDINPFVLILTNPDAWQAAYPGCPVLNGDSNGDGAVDFGDINPFVALLSQ